MAIEKMKMVTIIGKYDKLADTIGAYLKSGCFHQETASAFAANVKGFNAVSEENPYARHLQRLSLIFKNANIEPKFNSSVSATPDIKIIDEKMERIESRLGYLVSDRDKILAEIEKAEEDIEKLSHFTQLDVNIEEAFNSQFVKFRFGRLPTESFDKLKLYTTNPYVNFFPCETQKDHIWGMYLAPRNEIGEVDSIFNSLIFEKMFIPGVNGTPKQAIETLTASLEELSSKHKEICDIIDEFNQAELDEYFELYSQLQSSYDSFEIRRYATVYGDSFALVGWIPANEQTRFESFFSDIDAIEISYKNPDEVKSFKPPVKLKNRRLFKPFEYYIEMFGVPEYNEIDPTMFMAITYTVLFGIMFADVGQGIILALFGFIIYKFKHMKLGAILIPCGIAGSLFGLVFGSVFGFEHMLDSLYGAVGFDGKPIEVMDNINTILLFAVGIGVVLLITAIILNIVSCIKRQDIGMAIFSENGFFGLIIYISIVMVMFSLFVPAISSMTVVFIIAAAIGVVAVMFKEPLAHLANGNGRFKPDASMGEYVLQSVFEMIEALLSYLTNTVSFLRVGAFVLVHAGMMMVFFTLAEMMPNAFLYYFMIVFGNALVLVLEGLLVSIQSLRLEFYEMFSRFYSGEGKPFIPVKISNNR